MQAAAGGARDRRIIAWIVTAFAVFFILNGIAEVARVRANIKWHYVDGNESEEFALGSRIIGPLTGKIGEAFIDIGDGPQFLLIMPVNAAARFERQERVISRPSCDLMDPGWVHDNSARFMGQKEDCIRARHWRSWE